MSYTRPDADEVDFIFGESYTRPDADEVDFIFGEPDEFTAAGEGYVSIVGSGTGAFGSEEYTGDGSGTVGVVGAGIGAHGVTGSGVGALSLVGDGAGARGVAGSGSGALGLVTAGVAQHTRYEIRGEVKLNGALVNRRVRAYVRDTGELFAEEDTTLGAYSLHAGFEDDVEFYVIALNLDPAATDFIPPTANRVLPVLAMDT